MSSTTRRSVITGVGVLAPVGLDRAAYWSALQAGVSGIRPVRSMDVSALPYRIAGEVEGFDAKRYLEQKQRKQLRMMARSIQLGVCAAQIAMDDAGAKKGQIDPTRFGVEFGSAMIATELEDLVEGARVSSNCAPGAVDLHAWGAEGMKAITPLWMLKYLPNMTACHVSIIHDAQGPNNSITESDVASLLAIGEAYRVLERDAADFFLVGGGDSKLNPLSFVRHSLFQPLTPRNDPPAEVYRPFDRERDGMVLGEASAVFALEELEHAKRRGARVLAEVAGFGAAFDRKRDGSGMARAIRAALKQAGITPDQVDHVNAHGVGTVEGDAWEARGIVAALGADVPVWAVKPAIGNTGTAAGAVETAASVLALHHGEVPATLNYRNPDPACPVNVTREPRPVTKPYAVKVGATDLGQCAAVVLRRWEE
jgi:3-oxoacyl-[acyl-carrier-protein] synthase II